MAWQILAMWLVVGATVVWFVRDERHRRDAALRAQALRFAYAPHYRHPAPPEPPMPAPPARPLRPIKSADRAVLERYLRS